MIHNLYIENQFVTVYYVYIVTDKEKKQMQVGITVSLIERLQKLEQQPDENACKYLVYYESFQQDIESVKTEIRLSDYSQRKLRKFVLRKNADLEFLNDKIKSNHAINSLKTQVNY